MRRIGVIGSREMSDYGKKMIDWLVEEMKGREVELLSIKVRGCNTYLESKAKEKKIKIKMLSGTNYEELNYKLSKEADLLIVIEGGERSGTILVARNFGEEGKEVWAIPGRVGEENSKAGNFLIKNGAGLLNCKEDFDLIFDK